MAHFLLASKLSWHLPQALAPLLSNPPPHSTNKETGTETSGTGSWSHSYLMVGLYLETFFSMKPLCPPLHNVGPAVQREWQLVMQDKTSLRYKNYKDIPFFHGLNHFLVSVQYLKNKMFKIMKWIRKNEFKQCTHPISTSPIWRPNFIKVKLSKASYIEVF